MAEGPSGGMARSIGAIGRGLSPDVPCTPRSPSSCGLDDGACDVFPRGWRTAMVASRGASPRVAGLALQAPARLPRG